MYNVILYFGLVLCIFVLSGASLSVPVAEQEIPEQPKDISKIIASGSSALEENGNDPPVYIMVPVVGERSRRGAEDGSVNLENVSYEVPTFIKFNESAKGDIEVSLIPNPDNQAQQYMNGYGVPPPDGCPPLNNKTNATNAHPMPPICLTVNIDNIFPAGKKVAIFNSSEIKGTGAILRVRFAEAKEENKTTTCPSEYLGSGLDRALRQRLDAQKKGKLDDDEEDDDSATTQLIDQKTLQELIFKILTSNKTPSSPSPTEEVVFLEKFTTQPTFSFLINPSILQRMSRKRMTSATRRMTTLKSQNSPDFDSLLKTVEHITSSMPKEKLLSLLSSLINKATLNKEMSTNQ